MTHLPLRYLVIAATWCAVLYALARLPPRITPEFPALISSTHGKFVPNGQYPGEPLRGANNVRFWGSWAGDDANFGSIELGPFTAPRQFTIAVGGYPRHPGISLRLERVGTNEKEPIASDDVGERWSTVTVRVPTEWVGKSVAVIADDHAAGLGGWVAISEPLRQDAISKRRGLLNALAAWSINGALLGLIGWAAMRLLGTRCWVSPPWFPLLVAAVVAMCGYAAFWAYFAHPLLGRIFSGGVLLIAAGVSLRRQSRETAISAEIRTVAPVMLAIGFFYLSLLCLFPTSREFYNLAANRFRDGLPDDNALPHGAALTLYDGGSLKTRIADWHTSDRPPLQAGWQLLTYPVLQALRFDPETADGTAAIWLQLLWVPAAYGLFRTLGLQPGRSVAWIIVLSTSGFFLQNTVYTWPKLSAAALGCAAFATWFWPANGQRSRDRFIVGAALAALACLSHGGIAFSLLAVLPWVVARLFQGEFRGWMLAAFVFLLLTAPWLAFQRYYDPPGNRLIKMHLAGVPEVDPRGAWSTIRDSYHGTPWRDIVDNKISNFEMLGYGGWSGLWQFDPATSKGRRDVEFFFTLRALTWWVLGVVALPLVFLRRSSDRPSRQSERRAVILGCWVGLTIVIWCLLMFGPRTTSIHQGSYATLIVLFTLSSVMLEWSSRLWIYLMLLLQAASFVTTWTISNGDVDGPATGLPFVLASAAALIAIFFVHCRRSPAASLRHTESTRREVANDVG